MINNIIKHYDTLIGLDNDPARDPEPLKEYMDKWDGQEFIDTLQLDDKKSILEIGVGTGRLGIRVASLCKYFVGIDISPKTIERAKENFKKFNNVTLICGDFLEHLFEQKFDVIYSSLCRVLCGKRTRPVFTKCTGIGRSATRTPCSIGY